MQQSSVQVRGREGDPAAAAWPRRVTLPRRLSRIAGVARRLSRVTKLELRLLAEAQLDLIGCQLMKWRRPVGRLLASSVAEPEPATAELDRSLVQSVAWAVTRAARYGAFRPQCLVRSMAIQRMLRRRGVRHARLTLGVRLEGDAFQAHAWVELEGAVVGDTLHYVRSFTSVTDLRVIDP